MLKNLQKIYNERVIKWFYILLPIVEVITTYMVINSNTTVTIGMIYKTAFLLYGILYLLFVDKVNKKSNYILLGLFSLSIVLNFIITIDDLSIKALLSKMIAISKYVCFPIALMFLHKYNLNGNKVGLKTLVYSSMLYATVMLIAKITGTELPTYASNPDWGHTGWFYSGNEISALMAMFYPITIYFSSKYRNLLMKYALAVATYGLLTIGTKTSFLAVVITIVSILIFETIMYFIKKERLAIKMIFTSLILLIIVVASSSYSPSMKFIIDRLEKAKSDVYMESGTENNQMVYKTFVFNGREEFIEYQAGQYKKAPIGEKIFGMPDYKRLRAEDGLQGVVERDLYDILFIYGVFGFVVYFTPMLIIIFEFVKKILRNFKNECNEKNFVMGISIVLSLGISYIAGHVLLAPTVALFLSVVFSKLNYEIDSELLEDGESIKEINKKKMLIVLPKMSMGGMERSCANLLSLSNYNKNYDITLLIGYVVDDSLFKRLPNNIRIKILCKGKWNLFNKCLTALKYAFLYSKFFINRNKFDVSICYSHHHPVLAKLVRKASSNSIIFVHNDLEISRTQKQIDKMKFDKFRRVACVSNAVKETFKEKVKNYSDSNIYVINNYIDGERIIDMSKETLLETDLKDNTITFINIARHLEQHKKIFRILKAANRLRNEGYDFRIWLVGSGPDTENYLKYVYNEKLEKIVEMLGTKTNPYNYLKQSSALVLSSAFEGYGMVLDEARILNVPIITTDVADARVITQSGYGILCDNSDEGVYIGMKKFMDEGYTIINKFDYISFNDQVTKMLDKIVDF